MTVLDATATESPLTTGAFRVTRTGATTAPLTVFYTLSGTAAAGSDYQALGTSVSIPSGAATKDLLVTPVNDALAEGAETATLTLTANAAYAVGSPGSATVTLTSEDLPNLVGIYRGAGTSTETGCTDPDNDGGSAFSATITVTQQAGSSFSGSGTFTEVLPGETYTTSLTITAGTVTAAGTLSGSFTEVIALNGTPVVTGTGTFTGTLVGNTLTASFSSQAASGETCHSTGSLTATR